MVRVGRIARSGIGGVLVAGLIGLSSGTAAAERRVEHLVRAAAHLEQAGSAELAAAVRQQLEAECPAALVRLRERKQAEWEQLQAEMAQLEQVSGSGPPWRIQVRLFQVDWQRVEAMGLMLASLRDFETPVPDETGQLVALLESLQKQGALRILAEPALMATPGREATYESEPDRSGAAVRPAPSESESGWGTRVVGRLHEVDAERIELELAVRHDSLVWGRAAEPSQEAQPRAQHLGLRLETRIALVSGQPLLVGGLQSQSDANHSWGLIAVVQADRAD